MNTCTVHELPLITEHTTTGPAGEECQWSARPNLARTLEESAA
jgi:hypothetical protein